MSCKNSVTILSLVDELKREYQKQLTDIAKQAEELGKKEHLLHAKEHQLNCKAVEINQQGKENISRWQEISEREYQFYCEVLHSGHCKDAYVQEMGKDFWEDNLSKAFSAGVKVGKNEHEIKQEISYVMVSIYEDLELYDKAYDFLVEQASGNS